MEFQIREGSVTVILFIDYKGHNFALIIDWRGKTPKFKAVVNLKVPISKLFGAPVVVRGVLTRSTVEGFTAAEPWRNFLKKLELYKMLNSLNEANEIVAKLRRLEKDIEEKIRTRSF